MRKGFGFNLRLKTNHFNISDGLVQNTGEFDLKLLVKEASKFNHGKSVLNSEIEINFSEETQREGDKSNEPRIGPVEAELTHQMWWVQEYKDIKLVGYVWNYLY